MHCQCKKVCCQPIKIMLVITIKVTIIKVNKLTVHDNL